MRALPRLSLAFAAGAASAAGADPTGSAKFGLDGGLQPVYEAQPFRGLAQTFAPAADYGGVALIATGTIGRDVLLLSLLTFHHSQGATE